MSTITAQTEADANGDGYVIFRDLNGIRKRALPVQTWARGDDLVRYWNENGELPKGHRERIIDVADLPDTTKLPTTAY